MTRFSGPEHDRRRYRVTSEAYTAVRRGGQSLVYEGSRADARYAIKLLTGPLDSTERAEYLERINLFAVHPTPGVTRIVEAFVGTAPTSNIDDLHRDDFDTITVIEEWIDGTDLLTAATSASPTTQMRWLSQIGRAVDALHTNPAVPNGFVHRDLKPSNILISETGDAVVIDLGVARPDTTNQDWTSGTGTYRWTAPELGLGTALGADALKNADRWALGAIGHWMLTGSTPTPNHPHALTVRHLAASASKAGLSGSDRLAAAIAALLHPADDTRPRDLAAWADELETATIATRTNRRPLVRAGIAAAAVATILAGAAVLVRSDDPGGEVATRGTDPTATIAVGSGTDDANPERIVPSTTTTPEAANAGEAPQVAAAAPPAANAKCTDNDFGLVVTIPSGWVPIPANETIGTCQQFTSPVHPGATIRIDVGPRYSRDALVESGYSPDGQTGLGAMWSNRAYLASGAADVAGERGIAHMIERGPSFLYVTMVTIDADNQSVERAAAAATDLTRRLQATNSGCNNARRPSCGSFHWRSQPPTDKPVVINSYSTNSPDPAVGQPVMFTVTATDPDAESLDFEDACYDSTDPGGTDPPAPEPLWKLERARPEIGDAAGPWNAPPSGPGVTETFTFTRTFPAGTTDVCVTVYSHVADNPGIYPYGPPSGAAQSTFTIHATPTV